MTFVDGAIEGVVIRSLDRHEDGRGWLVEVFRQDELPEGFRPAMAYASLTHPGVVRGPHEHADQSDFFCFPGPGDFLLSLWDNRPGSPTRLHRQERVLGASCPGTVLVPPGVVHAYRSLGPVPGLVINCPDRLFGGPGRTGAVDQIRHEDDSGDPFARDERERRSLARG